MATLANTKRWYDPRQGDRPVRIEPFSCGPAGGEPPRTNYFTVYSIREGDGSFWADAACHAIESNALLFFVPYQFIRFEPRERIEGDRIQFHANFLCVETFHAEVGCSSALFNDPYAAPVVKLDQAAREEIAYLTERIAEEERKELLAHEEVTLAYLKILLVLASRLKASGTEGCEIAHDLRHPVIAELKELIERNYQSLHAPSAYAELLHMSPKALGRIVREQLGKTLTDLIQERILTHAKWQLLHTLRPVKEIAREVGYRDELYFSRLFKKATGCSPTFFREFETEIRGGSNLSMDSGHAPIQRLAAGADNSRS